MKTCTFLLAVLCAGTLVSGSYFRGSDRFRRMKNSFSRARRFGGVDGFTRYRPGGGSRYRSMSPDFSNQFFGLDSMRPPFRGSSGRGSISRSPSRKRSGLRSGFSSLSRSFRPSIGKIDTIGKDSAYDSMPGSDNFQRQGFLSGINFVQRPESKGVKTGNNVGGAYKFRKGNPLSSFQQDVGNGKKDVSGFSLSSNSKFGTPYRFRDFGHDNLFGDYKFGSMSGGFGISNKFKDFGRGSKFKDFGQDNKFKDFGQDSKFKDFGQDNKFKNFGQDNKFKDFGEGSKFRDFEQGSKSKDSGLSSQSKDSGYGSQSKDSGHGSKSGGSKLGIKSKDSGYGSQSKDSGHGSKSGDSKLGTKSKDSGYGYQSKDSGQGSKPRGSGHGTKSRNFRFGGKFRDFKHGFQTAKGRPASHFDRTFNRSGFKMSEISRSSFHPKAHFRGRTRYPSPFFGKH